MEPKVEVVYDFKHISSENVPGTVWVRVYFGRKNRKYISTGVKVLPSQWSDEYHVVNREDAWQLNKMIQEQIDKCKKKIKESLEESRVLADKEMKVERDSASFLNFIQKEMDQAVLADGTRKHHQTMLRSLEEFGKILRFEQVTNDNLESYMRWVREKGIEQTTIHDYYKRLRKYINLAKRKGFVPYSVGIDVKKGKSKLRVHLSDEELELLKNVDLQLPYLIRARDRFLIQCGTGVAFADLMNIDFSQRQEVDGVCVLSGQRQKTGETFFIVILPFAVEVLERYGWVVPPISNDKYNDYLDAVAIRCGINKHITSHVGRHTYACQCLAHGVSLSAIQRTLGHRSIKTTEIYARLMDADVMNEFKRNDIMKK